MINDAHCHFFSSRFLELLAPEGAGANEVALRLQWDPPGSPAELSDRWAGELDGHGITRAVLIASIPGDAASVGEAVSRHPNRFVGLFMHNPAGLDSEPTLERAFDELKMRGVCLFPAMHGYRLDEPCVEPVFNAAARHRGVVFVHCGVLTVGVRKKLGLPSRFDLRLGDPLALARAAMAHPGVPVIVPHFGAGFLREALMAAEQCPSIHFDTSSSNSWVKYHPGLTLADVFRTALSVVGSTRLLFGSDSSFFPRGWQKSIFDEQQRLLKVLGVSDADQMAIFSGNFDRLFVR